MQTHTFTVGAATRREFMIRLDELGLPYNENSTPTESVIVVQISNQDHEDAYWSLAIDLATYALQANVEKQQSKLREMEALRDEQLKKLARKNFFRRLTFRKPLEPRDTPLL